LTIIKAYPKKEFSLCLEYQLEEFKPEYLVTARYVSLLSSYMIKVR